jgi:long-chain acyl-CoA synthetase
VSDWRAPTVVELVRHHAGLVPDREFLVGYDGGVRRSWTYRAFDQVTDRIAAGLLASGLTAGDRLAIVLDNADATAFYRLLYGAYKASLVPVPVNPRLAPPEIDHIVQDSGARLVLRDAVRLDELEVATGPVPDGPGYETPMDLLYTSGTTGRPKGAWFVHRAMAHFAQQLSATLRLTGDDVFQTPAPVYTSTGTHTLPLPILAVGGTYVVEPGFDVEATATRLAEERSTVYFGVPAMHMLLLERLPADRAFPHLRSLMYGGSIMPEPMVRRLLERFPGVGLWNLYGLTEGGPNGTVLPPEYALTHPGSVGLPLDGTSIRTVDEEGRDVRVGEPGEILIAAPSLMEGYHGLPEATAEAIVDGWLHTGDIGVLDDDGLLSIVDRKKDLVVRGGFNVYPAEIEVVLLEHPAVLEVAVVGVAHPVLGEDVAAVVALREGASVDGPELAAFCAERLADFKRPRHWRFVTELPRNGMGKVQKTALREGWDVRRARTR